MSTRTRRGTRGAEQGKSNEPETATSGRSTRLRRVVSNANVETKGAAESTKLKSYASESVIGSKDSVPARARPKQNEASKKADRSSDRDLHQISILSQYSQLSQGRNQNQVILFVLPEGTTEATCEPNLSTAYLLCQDYNLSSQWIKEKDCLKREPVQGNVFVLAPFTGPAFTYLDGCRQRQRGINFEIIGPQCIRYSLQDKADCPIVTRGYPALTMALRDTLISLSGVPEELRASLTNKIQLMNGSVTSSLTVAVTHIVADNILTDKCTVAYSKGIPIMTVDWIEAVWKDSQDNLVHGTDPKYTKYVCPIFYKLVICVSSVTMDMKKALKNVIEAHGGQYTADLVRHKTSILVVPKDDGTKYQYAQQWKVPCVIPDWVEASKSAGHLRPLKDFPVLSKTAFSTPMHSMVAPLDQSNFGAISNVGSIQSRNCQQTTMTTFRGEESVVNPIELEEVLKKAASNGPYLDGCRIYLSGANKLEQVRKFLNASGATRLDRLNESVTHVLVTEKKVPPADLQVLKTLDHLPYVLTLDWLVESARQGSPANEETFLFELSSRTSAILETSVETSESSQKSAHGTISDLVEKKSAERLAASKRVKSKSRQKSPPSAPDNVDTGLGFPHQNQSAHSQEDETVNQCEAHIEGNIEGVIGEQNIPEIDCLDLDNHEKPETAIKNPQSPKSESTSSSQASDATRDPGSQSNDSVFPFEGRRIKIEIDDEEEKSELENLINGANGEVVEDNFEIVILPVVHSTNLRFSKAMCFTKQWVSDCVENGSFEVNEAYFHKPLRAFDGMLHVLSEVVVAISQYPNLEKEYLTALVTAMGGIVQDVFARKASKTGTTLRTTHLICPTTSNDKFRAAKKWGTPVVVAGWILDCFKDMQMVDTTSYNPELINDSDSILSYMPRTPKYTKQKATNSSKQAITTTARTSVMSNFPPSAEKQQISSLNVQIKPLNIFKTPRTDPKAGTPIESNRVGQSKSTVEILLPPGYEEMPPGYEEFVASGQGLEPIDIKSLQTKSYYEYLDEEKAAGRFKEREESFVMEGCTKEETRKIRLAHEMMGYNSPAPQGIYLKKRNSTPIDVMTARTWKQIIERSPGSPLSPLKTPSSRSYFNSPITSTPNINPLPCKKVSSAKEVTEFAIGIDRIKSLSRNDSQRSSLKRSSDSSVEEEDILAHPKRFIKKRRLSSDNESSKQEQEDISRHSSSGTGYSRFNSTTDSGEDIVQEKSISGTDVEETTCIFKDVVVWVEKCCPEYDSIVSCVTGIGGKIAVDVKDEDITHIVVQRYNSEFVARIPRVEVVLPSWVFSCKASLTLVDENQHKPNPIASSSRSMQALKNLLTEGDDEISNDGVGPPQFQVPPKLKKSSNSMLYNGNDQGQINPDEMDAPHIVWDDDDNEDGSDARYMQIAAIAEKENRNNTKSAEERACSDDAPSKTGGEKNQLANTAQRGHEQKIDQEAAMNIIRNKKYPVLPPNPAFMLSGLNDDDKTEASKVIKSLGGRILTTSEFDPATFGIIASSLARSEKVLGCIAAGKCLIKFEYLRKCKEAKIFLPLEDSFLWQKTDGTTKMEQEIAEAAYRWLSRCMKNPQDKPMNNFKFFLFETNSAKKAAYTRLIIAGGGLTTSNPQEATVIISDGKSKAPNVPNVPTHPALYLNKLILQEEGREGDQNRSS